MSTAARQLNPESLQKWPLEKLEGCFNQQKSKSIALRTEPLSKRRERLKKLRSWILANETRITEAVFQDFKKPRLETKIHEILAIVLEIRHALDNLHRWTAPKKVDAPITYFGTRSYIQYEPKGVSLIISPWNFPFSLCIGPLVSALAAGCTAIVKPSELTPNTSALICNMVTELFDEDTVCVVEGDAEISKALLALPFDHIFFTGSPQIGKLVMKSAAEHLSSVTLELGGKSPAIVDDTASLKDAAKRIAWAKFLNCGQACLAPDYVIIHQSVRDKFLQLLKEETIKQFGETQKSDFIDSGNVGRIVNKRHAQRIISLIEKSITSGAKVYWGGEHKGDDAYIAPTILVDVDKNNPVMDDEIFGPLLPVITYNHLNEVSELVNEKPKPLALYVFSNSSKNKSFILKSTSSGTACVNDCSLQFGHANLPFGGVNQSGFGKAHGHYGFLAFSNEKGVLKQKGGMTAINLFYPPYHKLREKIVDFVIRLH